MNTPDETDRASRETTHQVLEEVDASFAEMNRGLSDKNYDVLEAAVVQMAVEHGSRSGRPS